MFKQDFEFFGTLKGKIASHLKRNFNIDVVATLCDNSYNNYLMFDISNVDRKFWIFVNSETNEIAILCEEPSIWYSIDMDRNWLGRICNVISTIVKSNDEKITQESCQQCGCVKEWWYNFCPKCGSVVGENYHKFVEGLKCEKCDNEWCEVGVLEENDKSHLFSIYCHECGEIQPEVYESPFEAIEMYK